jgi:hypothetical protein
MLGRGIKSFFNKSCIMPLPTMPLPIMPRLWRNLSAKSPPATRLHLRICHSTNPQTSPMNFPCLRGQGGWFGLDRPPEYGSLVTMKMKLIISWFVCCWLIVLAGCVNTVDGHKRGGWPLSKDAIESTYDRPVNQIVSAAVEVLKLNGTVTAHNIVNNSLVAKVDTRTVYVRVDQMDSNVSRVVTQVRTKGGGADIAMASEIDKQIGMRLTASR